MGNVIFRRVKRSNRMSVSGRRPVRTNVSRARVMRGSSRKIKKSKGKAKNKRYKHRRKK